MIPKPNQSATTIQMNKCFKLSLLFPGSSVWILSQYREQLAIKRVTKMIIFCTKSKLNDHCRTCYWIFYEFRQALLVNTAVLRFRTVFLQFEFLQTDIYPVKAVIVLLLPLLCWCHHAALLWGEQLHLDTFPDGQQRRLPLALHPFWCGF